MSWTPEANGDLFGDAATEQQHNLTQTHRATRATRANADNHAPQSVALAWPSPRATGPQGEASAPDAGASDDLGSEHDPETMDAAPTNPTRVKRPSFATYAARTVFGPPGLYYHGQRQPKGDGDPEPFDTWLCSPLECSAATHDERGDNHGLLLRFKPPYGQWREWAMPLHLLKGSGEEMRGELLNMGLRIDPDVHRLLNRYLAQCLPDDRVIAATRVGWHQLEEGRVFVMPRRTLGTAKMAYKITFQSEYAGQDDFIAAGTLESWRQHIGALCSDNPLLVLAVSTALAGPLLHLCHRQSAGVHLVGDSSNGKTTALEVAASVWGGPDFKRTWRATGNGLEGIAAALSDTCLILDEIGEADGREVGSTIYALGNGTGKARANRSGGARQAKPCACWIFQQSAPMAHLTNCITWKMAAPSPIT